MKTKIFQNQFSFILYCFLVFLSYRDFQSKPYAFFYLIFASLIGWLWFFEKEEREKFKLNRWFLILPLSIVLFTRILPFVFSEAPLGYDTGIYKKTIEDFVMALPNLPQFPEKAWGAQEPWGLYLSTNLLSLIGLSQNQILYGYYILLNLFLGLSIYTTTKKFFNENAAILAVFLFTFSLTQFEAYWMMYYKNIAALFLMLMAFYLLRQRSWLVIPVAGFLGGLHQPTFLIFGLAMLAHFIFNKDKRYHFISGILILAIALSLYLHNPKAILNFLSPNLKELIKTFGPTDKSGNFFNFNHYRVIAFYFPLALLGLIYLFETKQFNYFFFYFVFNLIIIYFHLLFHNRFIIHLDIVLICLAGLAMSEILNKFLKNFSTKITLFIIFIALVYILFLGVLNKKPLISKEELDEIKSLKNLAKEDEYVMSTDAYYSPWVYGFSERKTIAPGLFEYDKWSQVEWMNFWATENLELRHSLLDRYKRPIYIFIGDRQCLDFSGDPRFKRISKRIWKYE